MTVALGGTFADPGASARDGCEGTLGVTSSGTVDPNLVGTYLIRYRAVDGAGNEGTATRTVMVVDQVPPQITVGPASQTAECGQGVTLSVQAQGTAPLSYQWRKDGSDLAAANGSDYTINPVALSDGGSYDVVVVGGGTGGAPAGIAAGRQDAKTLLLEYLHGLGGVGTMGYISSYYHGNRVGFTRAGALRGYPDSC